MTGSASTNERTRSSRATRWRQNPEGRRRRLLDAAAHLFGERGYESLRTREIAEAAGVSEGTLFHHFGSKDGLLRAVAEQYGRGFVQAMFGRAGVTTEPAPTTASDLDVNTAIRRAFAYVRHSTPRFGAFLLAGAAGGRDTAWTANRREIVESLAGIFNDWKKRGSVRTEDPKIAAELCFGLVEAALRRCFAEGDGTREDAYVREVVRAIDAMLQRSPGPSR